MPCGTRACAATIEPAPITAPLSTVAPMPTRLPSSMVQPCSTALCPIETRSPIVIGNPKSTWTEQLSCTLLPAPTTIGPQSARSTAPYQTLAPGCSVTSPTTTAIGATKHSSSTTGRWPPTAAISARCAMSSLPLGSPPW